MIINTLKKVIHQKKLNDIDNGKLKHGGAQLMQLMRVSGGGDWWWWNKLELEAVFNLDWKMSFVNQNTQHLVVIV